MQTPEGFEKESEGIYSKGEHTYIIDANTGKVEEYTGTNPGGESGNEPQLNQYGFYEDVVYEGDIMEGKVYVYFAKDLSLAKNKALYNRNSGTRRNSTKFTNTDKK